MFESEATRDFVQWGNVIGIPVLLIGLAVFRLLRRRQLTQQRYTPLAAGEAG